VPRLRHAEVLRSCAIGPPKRQEVSKKPSDWLTLGRIAFRCAQIPAGLLVGGMRGSALVSRTPTRGRDEQGEIISPIRSSRQRFDFLSTCGDGSRGDAEALPNCYHDGRWTPTRPLLKAFDRARAVIGTRRLPCWRRRVELRDPHGLMGINGSRGVRRPDVRGATPG
jgi:hypothetical protein